MFTWASIQAGCQRRAGQGRGGGPHQEVVAVRRRREPGLPLRPRPRSRSPRRGPPTRRRGPQVSPDGRAEGQRAPASPPGRGCDGRGAVDRTPERRASLPPAERAEPAAAARPAGGSLADEARRAVGGPTPGRGPSATTFGELEQPPRRRPLDPRPRGSISRYVARVIARSPSAGPTAASRTARRGASAASPVRRVPVGVYVTPASASPLLLANGRRSSGRASGARIAGAPVYHSSIRGWFTAPAPAASGHPETRSPSRRSGPAGEALAPGLVGRGRHRLPLRTDRPPRARR